jgi:hypothetical protein
VTVGAGDHGVGDGTPGYDCGVAVGGGRTVTVTVGSGVSVGVVVGPTGLGLAVGEPMTCAVDVPVGIAVADGGSGVAVEVGDAVGGTRVAVVVGDGTGPGCVNGSTTETDGGCNQLKDTCGLMNMATTITTARAVSPSRTTVRTFQM